MNGTEQGIRALFLAAYLERLTTTMTELTRIGMAARYSEAAIFQGIIFLAGQVPETTLDANIEAQTEEVLGLIEELLQQNGSDKRRILMCQIFLSDLADFDGMNRIWDAWVAPGHCAAPGDRRSQTRQLEVPSGDRSDRSPERLKRIFSRSAVSCKHPSGSSAASRCRPATSVRASSHSMAPRRASVRTSCTSTLPTSSNRSASLSCATTAGRPLTDTTFLCAPRPPTLSRHCARYCGNSSTRHRWGCGVQPGGMGGTAGSRD